MTEHCQCEIYPGELLAKGSDGSYYCMRCKLPLNDRSSDPDTSDKICPKDERIYLASPYTHDDPDVMQTRYELALYAASTIANAGYIVYSPIVYTHIMATQYDIQSTNSDWWVEFDRSFIENWATILALLKLPGWYKSSGVNKEKAMAKNNNLQQIELTMEHIYDISRAGAIRLA